MSDLVRRDPDNLLSILMGQTPGLMIPKPYERDIFLIETYVAGTSYIADFDKIEASLSQGDRLILYREAGNKHDPQAIRIETLKREKIGYIPRQDNLILSRLMDAGKVIFAKVADKDLRGNWLRMMIKVYLHEG